MEFKAWFTIIGMNKELYPRIGAYDVLHKLVNLFVLTTNNIILFF